jgi:hypothetical protein
MCPAAIMVQPAFAPHLNWDASAGHEFGSWIRFSAAAAASFALVSTVCVKHLWRNVGSRCSYGDRHVTGV